MISSWNFLGQIGSGYFSGLIVMYKLISFPAGCLLSFNFDFEFFPPHPCDFIQ